MLYGVCALSVPPGRVNAALDVLARTATAGEPGVLRACWYSEIGRLNRILMIHEHRDGDALAAARAAQLRGGNPFGIADVATSIDLDTYAMFPGVAFMPPGKVGPVFEVRTYQLKRNGLTATFEAWAKVREARIQLSPLTAVMYAIDGVVPRFMHIWPYPSLNDRMSIREQAVAKGVWPPPGGLPHLESMHSEIYLPAPFSPLH
jgi:hypothetical protein